MSKTRYLKTSFWSDPFIQSLSTQEKLLFIYLITNERVSICGIYEISENTICFDTGIDKKTIQKFIQKFTENQKITIIEGWTIIKNFVKHQNFNSPKVQEGIEREISQIPQNIIEKLYGSDTVSIGYRTLLNLTLPNFTLPNGGSVPSIFDDDAISRVVDNWNKIKITSRCNNPSVKIGKPIMMQCTQLTAEVKESVRKSIKEYSEEKVKLAIEEYAKHIASTKPSENNNYYEFRFSILKFFKQKNGLTEFITRIQND